MGEGLGRKFLASWRERFKPARAPFSPSYRCARRRSRQTRRALSGPQPLFTSSSSAAHEARCVDERVLLRGQRACLTGPAIWASANEEHRAAHAVVRAGPRSSSCDQEKPSIRARSGLAPPSVTVFCPCGAKPSSASFSVRLPPTRALGRADGPAPPLM